MSDVAAPAANTWDLDAIADAARDRVRTSPGDDDEARLIRCVAAAAGDIDQELDRVPPDLTLDPPETAFDAGAVPSLFDAAVDRAVDLFQARDDDIVETSDSQARMRARVAPWKARWGIG